jgi:hypothetical protein
MPQFFFDHRDGDRFYPDDLGAECETLEAARELAKLALAEGARDVLPGSERRKLAITVSNDNRQPLFRAVLWFEVQPISDRSNSSEETLLPSPALTAE